MSTITPGAAQPPPAGATPSFPAVAPHAALYEFFAGIETHFDGLMGENNRLRRELDAAQQRISQLVQLNKSLEMKLGSLWTQQQQQQGHPTPNSQLSSDASGHQPDSQQQTPSDLTSPSAATATPTLPSSPSLANTTPATVHHETLAPAAATAALAGLLPSLQPQPAIPTTAVATATAPAPNTTQAQAQAQATTISITSPADTPSSASKADQDSGIPGFKKAISKSLLMSRKLEEAYKRSTTKMANSIRQTQNKYKTPKCSLTREYIGHRDGIWEVNTCPILTDDQSFLVGTASADKTARLWYAERAYCVGIYTGHSGSVNSIRFHPSKPFAITASGDKTVHLWRLPSYLFSSSLLTTVANAVAEEEASIFEGAGAAGNAGHENLLLEAAAALGTDDRTGESVVAQWTIASQQQQQQQQQQPHHSSYQQHRSSLAPSPSAGAGQAPGVLRNMSQSSAASKFSSVSKDDLDEDDEDDLGDDYMHGKIRFQPQHHLSPVSSQSDGLGAPLPASSGRPEAVADGTRKEEGERALDGLENSPSVGNSGSSGSNETEMASPAANQPRASSGSMRLPTSSPPARGNAVFSQYSRLPSASSVFAGHQSVAVAASWLAPSSNSDAFVSASWDRTAKLWDATTGTLLQDLKGHEAELTNVATHSVQQLILTCSQDTTFRLWDFRTPSQRSVNVFQGHTGAVTTSVFANKEDLIISGGEDRSIQMWDLKNMRAPVASFRTKAACNRLAVSSEKPLMAIPFDDRHIRIYDLKGNQLARVARHDHQGHLRMATGVAWCPGHDSQSPPSVLSCGFDSKLLEWKLPKELV